MVELPINIGKFTLSNRIIIPAIVRMLANEQGYVTDRLLASYNLHAGSGASFLIVEASFIQPNGRILQGELSIDDDSCVQGLSELAKTIKHNGIPTIVQLVHAGRMGCGQDLIAPSPIPFEDRIIPRPMTIEEILKLKLDFKKAIERSMDSGFDGVEIHCAHGYILSQFLSPLSNTRVDIYGGSLDNRARLLYEIVSDARKRIGSGKILSVRLGAVDLLPGGLKLYEAKVVAGKLKNLGVDLINVSAGIVPTRLGGSRPRVSRAFSPLGKSIRDAVGSVVAVAGRITTLQDVEIILSKKQADLVAVCRSVLSDTLWPKKILAQNISLEETTRIQPIIPCAGCIPCIHFTKGCPIKNL